MTSRLLDEKLLTSVAQWAASLTLFLFVVISVMNTRYLTATNDHKWPEPPGLTLQVSNDPAAYATVLGNPTEPPQPWSANNRRLMRYAQYVDFFFIPCYVTLFATAGLLMFWMDGFKHMGRVAAVAIAAAGFCDVAENIGILRAIGAAENGQPMDAYGVTLWSIPKWALIMSSLLLLTPIVRRKVDGLFGLVLQIVMIVSALLGVGAVFVDQWQQVIRLITYGFSAMGIATAIFLPPVLFLPFKKAGGLVKSWWTR